MRQHPAIALLDFRVLFERLIYRRVSHALGASDYPFAKSAVYDLSLAADFHQDRNHQTIFLRVQRANTIGKFRGQHGNGSVGKVDGGAPKTGFAVQGGAGANIVSHIGYVHLQLKISVG